VAWVWTTRSTTQQKSLAARPRKGLAGLATIPGLEAEGKTDQSKADLKQAGEKVKDAFKKD
jgi:hypothetical protein